MPDMARNGLMLLRLMFGPRVGMFLVLVWRKEPFAEGRTSIGAWEQLQSVASRSPVATKLTQFCHSFSHH